MKCNIESVSIKELIIVLKKKNSFDMQIYLYNITCHNHNILKTEKKHIKTKVKVKHESYSPKFYFISDNVNICIFQYHI